MTVVKLHLDDQIMAQMQYEASQQQAELETLIQNLLERLALTKAGDFTLLRLVTRYPKLIEDFADLATIKVGATQQTITSDPIMALGTDPITIDVTDASENHDTYIYKL